MFGELGKGAGDGFAGLDVLGFEHITIGGQHELGLGPRSGRAGFQRGKRRGDSAGRGDGDMDVVALQNPANIGTVAVAVTQALNGRGFVAERFEELKRKFHRIERAFRQRRNGFFNFDGVHSGQSIPTIFPIRPQRAALADCP